MDNKNLFHGFKNVLVTGGCGFIASNFLINIVPKYTDTQFINIDCINYCASLQNTKEISHLSNYLFIKGNITHKDLISLILKQYSIDCIIHFAAQSHVDSSFERSLDYTIDNIYGTHILLECCREFIDNIKLFLQISTDEVYGESGINDNNDMKKTESSLLSPTNPYAATKASAELIARSYYFSFKLPVIVTRCNNVYGPRQFTEKVIPKFIQTLNNKQKCTIHGDGNMLRSFIYIRDVIDALEVIIQKGQPGEIFNIGSSTEISILELTKILIKMIIGEHIQIDNYITFVEDRKFNDKRYFICDKKLSNLGWSSNTDFIDGLKQTIDWYNSISFDKYWN